MKYEYEGKIYNVPDEEIDRYVEQLEISIAEACEMYLADHDLIKDKVVEELSEKAQKNRITATIHSAKGEKKERKPREKKENPLKKEIIKIIFEEIADKFHEKDYCFIKNDEKYIDFSIDGREFTINLVEHRKKKD